MMGVVAVCDIVERVRVVGGWALQRVTVEGALALVAVLVGRGQRWTAYGLVPVALDHGQEHRGCEKFFCLHSQSFS